MTTIKIDRYQVRTRSSLASHTEPDSRKAMVSIRLPEVSWLRLRLLAQTEGTSAGEIVRAMIDDLLDRVDRNG